MRIFIALILSLTSFLWIDTPVAYGSSSLTSIRWIALSITWLGLPIMHLTIANSLFILSRFVDKLKPFTIPLLQYSLSIGFIMFFCGILKLTVARARPYLFLEDGITGFAFGNFGHSFRSFPSSHSAVAVALALLFIAYSGGNYRYTPWIFVVLIAVTRIVLQKHFISDILIGVLIGQLVTSSIIFYTTKNKSAVNKILETVL